MVRVREREREDKIYAYMVERVSEKEGLRFFHYTLPLSFSLISLSKKTTHQVDLLI